tara:strand:- start:15453 stop:16217 length:765 start_codon:yes stop_codon:yes gene_type:complete
MSSDLQNSIDAVNRSKICARNYADKEVSEELIEHLLKVATGGPYKQGRRWLDIYAITNKEKCLELWKDTARPDEDTQLLKTNRRNRDGTETTFIGNAQVIAPVLFVFTVPETPTPSYPVDEWYEPSKEMQRAEEIRNQNLAIGSSMGMLVFEANRLGLQTGNCVCYDADKVTQTFRRFVIHKNRDIHEVILMVGVGYPVIPWSEKDNDINTGTEQEPEYAHNPQWQMREHPLSESRYNPPDDELRDNPRTRRIY